MPLNNSWSINKKEIPWIEPSLLKKWTLELTKDKDSVCSPKVSHWPLVMPVQIINAIEDPKRRLAEWETSQILEENWQLNKPLISFNQMQLVMNTMTPNHLEPSLDPKLAPRFYQIKLSSQTEDTNWWETLNSSTWRNSTYQRKDWRILQSTLWQDLQVNAFRKSLSILRMLTRERKIIESLITREELLLSWTKESHTLPQSANTEHLTHGEPRMVLRDNSQTSQDGLTMHHHMEHSELVTYQSTATIELLDQIVPISRTQWRIL